MSVRAAVFAVVLVATFAAHEVGDHWVQTVSQDRLPPGSHNWLP
jgi:hypothetical protein